MVQSIQKNKLRYYPGILAIVASGALFSSCATKYSTEPTPTTTTQNSVTLDQFYTPAPNGEADDYYLLMPGDDDNDYSYFIDEQDYNTALNDQNDPHYQFIRLQLKNGHGYGDANHIHEFVPGPHHEHGVYINIRHRDWTDSLALTDSEKVRIDTAMKAFIQCAKASVDSFKVALQPYRLEFKTRRTAIIAGLDSGKYSRDSARTLLDSAIVKYQAETSMLRAGFIQDLATCRTELDVDVRAILTPDQYAIWVRHRGW